MLRKRRGRLSPTGLRMAGMFAGICYADDRLYGGERSTSSTAKAVPLLPLEKAYAFPLTGRNFVTTGHALSPAARELSQRESLFSPRPLGEVAPKATERAIAPQAQHHCRRQRHPPACHPERRPPEIPTREACRRFAVRLRYASLRMTPEGVGRPQSKSEHREDQTASAVWDLRGMCAGSLV